MLLYGLVCGRGEIINIGATSCIGQTKKEKSNNQSQRVSSLSCIIILYESKKKLRPWAKRAKMLAEFDLSGVIACHAVFARKLRRGFIFSKHRMRRISRVVINFLINFAVCVALDYLLRPPLGRCAESHQV